MSQPGPPPPLPLYPCKYYHRSHSQIAHLFSSDGKVDVYGMRRGTKGSLDLLVGDPESKLSLFFFHPSMLMIQKK